MNKKLVLIITTLSVFSLVLCSCSKSSGKNEANKVSETAKKEQTEQGKVAASKSDTVKENDNSVPKQAKVYADGQYEGKSEETSESYYATAKITIQNNKIKSADVKIIDGDVSKRISYSLHAMDEKVIKKLEGVRERVFDETYGTELFPGEGGDNSHYREQCKKDLAGLKSYIEKLISEQDINKVDVVSGATWSNMLFKGAVLDALQKAEKE